MHTSAFLETLAIVLGVAGLTTVVFHRLRQPVVLGYLLAGVIVGPHVPIPIRADAESVRTLSELGVILLLFSMGLELRLGKLGALGRRAGPIALVEASFMAWLGYLTARLFGWSPLESLFTGSLVAISSSTIIAKTFAEQGVRGPLRELVFGILVIEDLIAIVLMAMLTAVASGRGLSPGAVALTIGRLALFLAGVVGVGLLLVPRVVRAVVRLGRPEVTLVASLGLCFAVSLLALELGYSVALGAFLAGSLIAESGEAATVERLVEPVRDMFGAIFFVSAGMLIDPGALAQHWGAILAFTAVVIAGKVVGGTVGTFLAGHGTRVAVQTGLSLAQIGEMSFIVAALGVSLGAVPPSLYAIAVAVSALTTLLAPWLIRGSGRVAGFVDRKLPAPLQTFASLYGSWLEGLRARTTAGSRVRRLVLLLALDGVCVAGIVIAGRFGADSLAAALTARLGVAAWPAGLLVAAACAVLALPFCVGIFRVARALGLLLGTSALPRADGDRPDLGAAPRRALVMTLQLAVVLAVAMPVIAITQPFVGTAAGAVALAVILVLHGVLFWRRAVDLDGHVRAGAQVLIEGLLASAQPRGPTADAPPLPGIGDPERIEIPAGVRAVGQTLSGLDLRAVTGAVVLAITSHGRGIVIPTGRERLEAGDVLAVAGSHEAVASAKRLLTSPT